MKVEVYKFLPMYGNTISALSMLAVRLEELAQKGFFIVSPPMLGFGRFRKGIPASVRYLVLSKDKSMPTQEDCENLGWELVDSASENSHLVYMTKSIGVEVPQIDQKAVSKQLYKGLVFYFVLLAAIIVWSAFNLFQPPESALDVNVAVSMGLAFIGCIVELISLLFDLLKMKHSHTIMAVRKAIASIVSVLFLGYFSCLILLLLYATIQLFVYG